MKTVVTFLTIIVVSIIPLFGQVDDTKHLDDTVAAGIIFKLAYLFQSEGTWSDMSTANPKSFQKAMLSISKDSANFSKTERGGHLKNKGDELIAFLVKSVRLTSSAPDPKSSDKEGDKFLRGLGLDPDNADPSDLAEIFTKRIATFALLSNTPEWVYDPTKKRENKSLHTNP